MRHLIHSLITGWLRIITPKHYRDAIIGDLFEAYDSDRQQSVWGLMWQVIKSTPSLLGMRLEEKVGTLPHRQMTIIATIGLSCLLLERFLWGEVVWQLAGYWSVESVLVLRFMYLLVCSLPLVVLCSVFSLIGALKPYLSMTLHSSMVCLLIALVCHGNAWLGLYHHFTWELLGFRLLQLSFSYCLLRYVMKYVLIRSSCFTV